MGRFQHHFDICRVANEADIEDFEMKFMSHHAIFNLFHVCICSQFENKLISCQTNKLRGL
jgi:hypothetical protein